MTALYVEIVVNVAGPRSGSYVYRVPTELAVLTGQLVQVPFGASKVEGIVVGPAEPTGDFEIRDVLEVFDTIPVLTSEQISLARWISSYYCASLVDAVRLMLPPGRQRPPRSVLARGSLRPEAADLDPLEQQIIDLVDHWSTLTTTDLVARLGKSESASRIRRFIASLVRREVLARRLVGFARPAGPRQEPLVRLVKEVEGDELRRAPKQQALYAYMSCQPRQALPLGAVLDEAGVARSALDSLVRRGVLAIEWRSIPLASFAEAVDPETPHVLTAAQQNAWDTLEGSLSRVGSEAFLLHGVTGSGKTELYLRVIAFLRARGEQVIVLVPEIALTPQTLHRFNRRFPGRVAMLHSRLTPREHRLEWDRIRAGAADVVVGSRSAVFAPTRRLGAIIVDEEHDSSYKQFQATPRYHARDVAVRRAELAGAKVILGSATPDLGTYDRAERGLMRLLTLPERVPILPGSSGLRREGGGLPPVEIVDLRAELRTGNRSVFSRSLHEAIDLALGLGEQVILFLNRRGDSTFVMCRDCGFVIRCKRCDAPLVYHSAGEDLVCHLCNARRPNPGGCPSCWGSQIRYFGIGTQRLAAETQKAFPKARVLRWDRDAARGRNAHETLLRTFVNHEADILVGTQMIAQGLDLPRVTLVGIIGADTALHIPDYRAAERTFQLSTQVAGRAGRGILGGRVIIQTYSPEHHAIQAASKHDYALFFEREMAFRREQSYPPFSRLIRLIYSSYGEDRSERMASETARAIRLYLAREGIADIDCLGPAPAFYRRVRGRYRWQIVLKGDDSRRVLEGIDLPPGWIVDVDPVSTL